MEAFALNIASNLAYDLLKAGARRFGEEWLGGPEWRTLQLLFRDATATMLAELSRSEGGSENQDLLGVLEYQFGVFFCDSQVAELLLDVALAADPPPLDTLRGRFVALGFDPDTFLVSFDRAMRVFAYRLAEDLREEASRSESAVHNLVEMSDLQAMRELLRNLLERQATIGPDVEELWRESRARCVERWRATGLSREESLKLADNPLIGAPGPRIRAALSRPVAIVVGEIGAGKSLLLDRLLQRAVIQLRDGLGAPLPVYIEAWEVTGRLRDTVLEKTSSLGNARNRGAVVFIDGAEEAGRAHADRLLKEARILVGTWPNTSAVIAGRPLPEFAEQDEMIQVPKLSAEETKTLIERLTGRELRHIDTYPWPQSVKEAAQRPLFATLLSLDLRDQNFRNPRSTGELLSSLVARALARAEETVELEQLRRLAMASTDLGRGPVRVADIASTTEAQRLRGTGLVYERNGTIGFSLQILNEWFAAQALETGLLDPRDLASDPARLERWRYPLVIAVGTFGYQRVKNILDPIARAAPAFASQVVEKGLAKWGFSEDTPPPPPLESGRQLRAAMKAWVEGIGSLANLIGVVLEDGTLAPVAVSTSATHINVGWYRGDDELEDVSLLTAEAWLDLSPKWVHKRMARFGRQPAWAWRWTMEDLRDDLSKLLKDRRFLINGGLLAKESAWDVACGLTGARSNCRSVRLEEIESHLDSFGWDKDEVAFARGYGSPRRYDLRNLKEQVVLLRESGEAELRPPWPMHDLSFDDPAVRQLSDAGTVYTWDLYSDEALFELAQIVLEGALEGYHRFVEEHFLRLAPHMQVAVTLPARLTGTVIRSSPSPNWDRSPRVAWYLEPLSPGSQNEVDLRVGDEYFSREYMLGVLNRLQRMRPEAAGWISSRQYLTGELFGRTPATELTYELMWNDLKRASWVDGSFRRRSL